MGGHQLVMRYAALGSAKMTLWRTQHLVAQPKTRPTNTVISIASSRQLSVSMIFGISCAGTRRA